MKKTAEQLAQDIWGKKAEGVIQFFENEIPRIRKFYSKEAYLNKISSILKEYCLTMEKYNPAWKVHRDMLNKEKNNLEHILDMIMNTSSKLNIKYTRKKEVNYE